MQLVYYARTKERQPLRWRVQILKNNRSRFITAQWILETLERQGYKCAISGRAIDVRTFEVDHIRPRTAGGSDELVNLQLVCREANAAKGALSNDELAALCVDILATIDPEAIGRAILRTEAALVAVFERQAA